MDDLAAVGEYFARKGARWTSTDGSVSAYLRRLGRSGLIAEFRSDPDFEPVSRYLLRLSDVQYVDDPGYSEFKTKVQESVFGPSARARGVKRQVDRIALAALLACGVSPFGERLVRIAGNLPRA
jgi:hypothetical protein